MPGVTILVNDESEERDGDAVVLRWLGAAALVPVWAAFVRSQVRRAARVWRGEDVTFLPMSSVKGPELNYRNYPTFAVVAVLFSGVAIIVSIGELLVGESGLKREMVFKVVVASVGLLSLALVPVLSVITAFNRPRWLVPPSLRGDAGSWARSRASRARRRAALPATDHQVEILDVRPAPDDPKSHSPYFVAMCTFKECQWMSDVVNGEDRADAEQAVRHFAASHSSNVVGPRRPVG